jgi:hypothetical protein
MSMKKSSDTIGNRTCDFSACSAVPQPTAPPRAPHESLLYLTNITVIIIIIIIIIITEFLKLLVQIRYEF